MSDHAEDAAMEKTITGKAYVLGDNVDTDQIIPAHYLMYNPSIPEERRQFGRYALCGVPDAQAGLPRGNIPFVDLSDENNTSSPYTVVIAGKNFGCGSSREHAPLALAEAGIKAVIARFYARIFYRNAVNGGYLVPLEWADNYPDTIRTGDEVRIDLTAQTLTDLETNTVHSLKPLGEVAPIVEAGGVFNYAKQTGML